MKGYRFKSTVTGIVYTLYKAQVKSIDDRLLSVYFFSDRKPKIGEPCELPEGYKIGQNPRTGQPILLHGKKLPNLDKLPMCPNCGDSDFRVTKAYGNLGLEFLITCKSCGTEFISSNWTE